ncbi:hypothetical protein AGRA3207_004063 [Actinomadura graeca]|uniref:Uncharacterized protein n=1 Tax=Actinomadura graeca TaxID=2750812 RepID=A0ABX8QZV0_9ACTN|nr:DUF6069 family protein [Actinomadura graeca]QXJ22977.1 hypothetical protein AGRA3207_004063 [Actinomadura graeca]
MSTTITAPARVLASRPVWFACAAAGLAASAATELYGLAARAAGVPMQAGGVGAPAAEPITVGMFAMGTLICTFWGTVLALVLARFASRPSRVFVRAAVPLAVLSLVGPVAAGDTAVSTKVMLCVAHVLAAAIVIPVVARRLARS